MFEKGLSIFLAVFLSAVAISATPLDDYVNTPDPHYKYELIYTYNDQVDYKIYILNMTSQKWKDETFVKNPIWWHYVVISVPNKVLRPDAAFMFIAGGSQESSIPTPNDKFVKLLGLFAASTGTIAVNLFQIPNQPTVFVDDPTQQRRTEDAVIAWTWKKFIENTNDPYVLLRLPMTKAAVRAMDAATEFTLKQGFADIKKWMIGGESKRGWTTWTTAAVDKRVFAAMPIVMDMLDFNTNLHKHFMSLGGWTFEFYDYYVVNITTKVDSPELFEMARIIDPKFYLDRYKNIKLLVINTAGDEFFFHDNTHSYWSDLVSATSGTALLRRIPNAEHALIGHTMSLFFSFRSFFLTNYERHENKKNAPQPLVRWLRSNNATHGIIQVIVDIEKGAKPSEVEVYYARTLEYDRRDFRLRVNTPGTNGSGDGIWHPVIWEKTKSIISKNETSSTITYRAAFLKPLAGWLGFFFQLSFPSVEHSVNVVTTETNIIPESYPFPDCTLDSCYGTLV